MTAPRQRSRIVSWIIVLLTAAILVAAFVGASLDHGDRLWLLAFWLYAPPLVFVGWLFVPTGGWLKRVAVALGAAGGAFYVLTMIHRIADALFG